MYWMDECIGRFAFLCAPCHPYDVVSSFVSYISMSAYPDIFITHRHFKCTQPVQNSESRIIPTCQKSCSFGAHGASLQCLCKHLHHSISFTQMISIGKQVVSGTFHFSFGAEKYRQSHDRQVSISGLACWKDIVFLF